MEQQHPQSSSGIKKTWGNFIQKWGRYYKVAPLLQSRTLLRTKVH